MLAVIILVPMVAVMIITIMTSTIIMPAAPLCNCLCVMFFTDSGGSDWDCDSGDAAAGEVLVRIIILTQTVVVHGHL